jgi:AcrR family transcriptional regulator
MTTQNRQMLRSQAAQDNIVQAALTVFALKGYAASSMDDVCMAAGCSKGGLYHHFRTKHALLTAAVERLASTGSLLPPNGAEATSAALPAASLGRLLIDVWAEAARDAELREQLRTGYEANLGDRVETPGAAAVAEILRIGALIQLLTRSDGVDADEAAQRLGLKQAA